MVDGPEMEILPFEGRADPMEDVPVLKDAPALGLDFLTIGIAPNRIVIDPGGMRYRSRQQRGKQRK